MKPACPRCGADLPAGPDGEPCVECWEGRAGADEVRELARRGTWTQANAIARLADPRAVPALRELAEDPASRLRVAALLGLRLSGGPADVPVAVAALDDPEPDVRAAARAALAQIGGPEAAGALAARIAATDDEHERWQVTAALAWLRDPRALPEVRRALASALPTDHGRFRYDPAWALARLTPGASEEGLLGPRVPVDTSPAVPPAGPRCVPRRALAGWVGRPPRDPASTARVGGQPDWLEAPGWPLAADGRPMVFYGQFPVEAGPGRMAYLFLDLDPESEHWEPLGAGNELLVQPGPPCRLPTVTSATGPGLYVPVEEPPVFSGPLVMQPLERWAVLVDGLDPVAWEFPGAEPGQLLGRTVQDWNKLGGTPFFLQAEEWPPGEGWRFAFQFSAARAGMELADGAECYGFVRDDGTGAFLWQCH